MMLWLLRFMRPVCFLRGHRYVVTFPTTEAARGMLLPQDLGVLCVRCGGNNNVKTA